MTMNNGRPRAEEAISVELVRILEQMLADDEKITIRAVSRKHSVLKHASTIIRNDPWKELVIDYQARQKEMRAWADRLPKRSNAMIVSELAAKDSRIAELEKQIGVLRLACVGMIRAVGELGGTSSFVRLFRDFEGVVATLEQSGVWPTSGVTPIKKRGKKW